MPEPETEQAVMDGASKEMERSDRLTEQSQGAILPGEAQGP